MKLFGSTLTPANDFTGRFIQEFQPVVATDYCRNADPQQAFPLVALTPQNPWEVRNGQFYGWDQVGYTTAAVNYYRQIGAVPCTGILVQRMNMLCIAYPNDTYFPPPGFRDQYLLLGIDRNCDFANVPGQVASKRDTVCDFKTWP